jgi:hypothetical protein
MSTTAEKIVAADAPPFADDSSSLTISPRTHALILIGCVAVVALSMTMSIQGGEKVSLPGANSPLPELCHLKRVLHIPCPGCGLTRSFISMGHFDLFAAAHYNVAGVPLFLMTLLEIPYRAFWLLRRDGRRMPLGRLKWEGGLLIGLSVLLVVQWAIRMALGGLA